MWCSVLLLCAARAATRSVALSSFERPSPARCPAVVERERWSGSVCRTCRSLGSAVRARSGRAFKCATFPPWRQTAWRDSHGALRITPALHVSALERTAHAIVTALSDYPSLHSSRHSPSLHAAAAGDGISHDAVPYGSMRAVVWMRRDGGMPRHLRTDEWLPVSVRPLVRLRVS